MLKFLRVPFALSGTRTAVPDSADPSGFVSYIEGYGADYQRPKTDPLSKNIERDKMNSILYDTTSAISELQSQGIPDFITTALNGGSPFSYAINAKVRWTDGNTYRSLVAANTSTPADLTKWVQEDDSFSPTLNYAAHTLRHSIADRAWNPRDYPWLAKFDDATDDTAAILACWTALKAAGGGDMMLPRGTARVTSLALDYTTSTTVNVRGAGMHATYFRKFDSSTTPILDIKSNPGVLDVYSKFSGFQVKGITTCTGIKLTTISSVRFEQVEARECAIGFDLAGCLVSYFYQCSVLSNATGVRTRKDSGIYCNSLRFQDCDVRANTTLGWDIGDASDLIVAGGHAESNGTTIDLNTGAVRIRSTVDDEVGLSNISFRDIHFEANLGVTFVSETCAGLLLGLDRVTVLSAEAGQALNVGLCASVALNGVIAATPGDTVTLAAVASTITNSDIATITDTSTHQTRLNVTTSAGVIPASIKTLAIGTGGLSIDNTAKVTSAGAYSDGAAMVTFQDGAAAGNQVQFFQTNGNNGNAAATSVKIGRSGTTARSINAGGTINASGADYAEYEIKVPGCGVFAPGDVVGFDSGGLLTDRFVDAISFGIKSTNPGHVGGDNWGDGLEGDELEMMRQHVDRIAYCGKVPLNLLGTLPGQWIGAVATEDGGIQAAPACPGDPNIIGRVRSILSDGRALVVV